MGPVLRKALSQSSQGTCTNRLEVRLTKITGYPALKPTRYLTIRTTADDYLTDLIYDYEMMKMNV